MPSGFPAGLLYAPGFFWHAVVPPTPSCRGGRLCCCSLVVVCLPPRHVAFLLPLLLPPPDQPRALVRLVLSSTPRGWLGGACCSRFPPTPLPPPTCPRRAVHTSTARCASRRGWGGARGVPFLTAFGGCLPGGLCGATPQCSAGAATSSARASSSTSSLSSRGEAPHAGPGGVGGIGGTSWRTLRRWTRLRPQAPRGAGVDPRGSGWTAHPRVPRLFGGRGRRGLCRRPATAD